MLLDRGSYDEAEQALDLAKESPQMGDSARLLSEARAKAQFTRGDYEQALTTLDSIRDHMTVMENPVWRPWRSMRARVLARLGQLDEAVELVEEELALARRWGSPALVGKTLRVLGVLLGDDGVPQLEQAVALLEDTPNRLELSRALADLGGRYADGGDPRGVELLSRALELAETCAADGLRVEVAERLSRLGVDVPTAPRARLTLTASERRIAEMAADGVSYPAIAQALFVTTSTVTTIVEAVCERLGAASPADLRPALDAHPA
jgi:ATP/maltotriose-dependent transcriptional regulator MalT